MATFSFGALVFFCLCVGWHAFVALGSGAYQRCNNRAPDEKYWWACLVIALVGPPYLALQIFAPPAISVEALPFVSPSTAAAAHISSSSNSSPSWLEVARIATLIVYCVGLCWECLSWLREAQARTKRLRNAMWMRRPAVTAGGVTVVQVSGEVDCYCVAGRRPKIILSEDTVAKVSSAQLALIVAHELCHLRRGDPDRFSMLMLVRIIFWFSPFLRALIGRVTLAAEMACDRSVLASMGDRHSLYAETLVASLSTRRREIAAFGSAGEIARIRLRAILDGDGAKQSARGATAVFVVATIAVALSIGAGGGAWARNEWSLVSGFQPAVTGRISQGFGRQTNVGGYHDGVDIAAPRGTLVRTPAEARVVYVGRNFQGQSHLGLVVALRHPGKWVSVYAHLDDAVVVHGQRLRPGQILGRVGNSGRSTGPHVHIEMIHADTRLDPQALGVVAASPN